MEARNNNRLFTLKGDTVNFKKKQSCSFKGLGFFYFQKSAHVYSIWPLVIWMATGNPASLIVLVTRTYNVSKGNSDKLNMNNFLIKRLSRFGKLMLCSNNGPWVWCMTENCQLWILHFSHFGVRPSALVQLKWYINLGCLTLSFFIIFFNCQQYTSAEVVELVLTIMYNAYK